MKTPAQPACKHPEQAFPPKLCKQGWCGALANAPSREGLQMPVTLQR